jgi:hypothetical protein
LIKDLKYFLALDRGHDRSENGGRHTAGRCWRASKPRKAADPGIVRSNDPVGYRSDLSEIPLGVRLMEDWLEGRASHIGPCAFVVDHVGPGQTQISVEIG